MSIMLHQDDLNKVELVFIGGDFIINERRELIFTSGEVNLQLTTCIEGIEYIRVIDCYHDFSGDDLNPYEDDIEDWWRPDFRR